MFKFVALAVFATVSLSSFAADGRNDRNGSRSDGHSRTGYSSSGYTSGGSNYRSDSRSSYYHSDRYRGSNSHFSFSLGLGSSSYYPRYYSEPVYYSEPTVYYEEPVYYSSPRYYSSYSRYPSYSRSYC